MPSALSDLQAALSGRYTVDREIGSGGMAIVYLARDLKHDREVALKVLRPELSARLGAERFLNEIRITAGLAHPNILTLIDSGEAGGFLYCVLPFIQGESLRQRLDRDRQLPVADALAITGRVAAALNFAHRQGIVHRDIKPENILFQEGQAMLTDFGIALAIQDAAAVRLTEPGVWLGTLAYMSPEQVTGDTVLDGRSDLYSLAAVLYEMLAGEPPHTAPSQQSLMAKRLVDPAPSVRRLRAAITIAVDQALLKALATSPADRFATVQDFVAALTAPEPGARDPDAVAVLPFLNLSSDPENEFFADGVTEDVIAHLSKVRALRVISRTSVMPFKNRELGLRDIAARLQATTVLDGSVRRAGDRVRIVAQLVDPISGQHLWSETYDRQLTDIFAIQTDVALRIAQTLEATLSPDEQTRIQKEPTRDLQAYGLYLQGRHWLHRFTEEGIRQGIAFFDRAIARDPEYALAYVGIGMAWAELGETGAVAPGHAYQQAKEAAGRAMELREDLADTHCLLGYLKALADFDWNGSEREFRRALELNPSSADAYDLFGRVCSALQRYDEAVDMSRKALELDPLAHRNDLATAFLRAGRYEEAHQAILRGLELDPGYDRAHATLGWVYLKTGRLAEGVAELERALALSPESDQWLAQLGQALAMNGREDEARGILQRLEARGGERYVSPYYLAFVHTGLGELDAAIEILMQAIKLRSGAAYGINGSFLLAPLRSHSRYPELLQQLNLAP